jgi:hypothetical protein
MRAHILRSIGWLLIIGAVCLTAGAAPALSSTPPAPSLPTVIVNPGTVTFPTQNLGAIGSDAVLTARNNTGFAAQSAYVSGDPHFSTDFNDCTTVPAGGSCDFGLVFTPTSPGPLNKTVQIVLCSGPNNTGKCVQSNPIFVQADADTADGSCPTGGAPLTTINEEGLVVKACVAQITRPGDFPLYVLSGFINISGLRFTASGDDTHYTASFPDCTADPCASAIQAFNATTGAGPEIVIAPTAGGLRIVSNRKYLITFGDGEDETTLYDGHLDLSFGEDDAVLDANISPLTKLLGLPLTGRFQVFRDDGGVRIHVNIGLPAALGGVTGETDVSIDELGNVNLNAISIAVGDAVIGPLRVRNASFSYNQQQARYAGAATLSLPTPRSYGLTVALAISGGQLESLSGEGLFPAGVPIGYGALLHAVRASVTLLPHVELGGGLTVGVGPNVRVGNKDIQAARTTADFKAQFPGRYDGVEVPYTRLRADGTIDVLSSPLASGFLLIPTNGYFEAGGKIQKSVTSLGSVKGTIHGEISGNGFNLEGSATLSVKFLITLEATGKAIVSSTGIAGCATFNGWLSGGIGYKWGQSGGTFDGCDLGEYRVLVRPTEAREANTDSRSFTLPAGLPEAAVEVAGSSASPDFRLRLPDGRMYATPAIGTAGEIGSRYAVIRESTSHVTVLVFRHPASGTYTVLPMTGSAAIRGVKLADGLAAPQASATVTGSGLMRTLHWHLRTEPDQVVHFVELGPEDDAVLATTSAASGHARFRVPDGVAGTREIQAQFEEAGLPRADETVGHYTAPAAPVPKRPSHLTLTRQTGNVNISWSQKGQAPEFYQLEVTLGTGQKSIYLLRGSDRSYSITPAVADDSVSAKLEGVDTEDVAGPEARRSLARTGGALP